MLSTELSNASSFSSSSFSHLPGYRDSRFRVTQVPVVPETPSRSADNDNTLRYAFRMRATQLRCFALALSLLISSALAAQQTRAVAVAIRVVDPTGSGVPRAQLRIVPAPEAASNLETDTNGQLALSLNPGGYAIFVRVPGFKNAVTHLDVVNADLPHSDAPAPKPAQTFSIRLELGATGSPMVSPVSSKDSLLVSAYPYHDPVGFSTADLSAMSHVTVMLHNPHTNADEKYSGVRLADILGKLGAPLGPELRGEALTNYIVATGADGYQAVLALAEIDPSFHPGEVLVVDAMNGKPLDAHSGPFKLVVTEDKRPARSVRNLTNVELKLFP
jgi:hypothetical protein